MEERCSGGWNGSCASRIVLYVKSCDGQQIFWGARGTTWNLLVQMLTDPVLMPAKLLIAEKSLSDQIFKNGFALDKSMLEQKKIRTSAPRSHKERFTRAFVSSLTKNQDDEDESPRILQKRKADIARRLEAIRDRARNPEGGSPTRGGVLSPDTFSPISARSPATSPGNAQHGNATSSVTFNDLTGGGNASLPPNAGGSPSPTNSTKLGRYAKRGGNLREEKEVDKNAAALDALLANYSTIAELNMLNEVDPTELSQIYFPEFVYKKSGPIPELRIGVLKIAECCVREMGWVVDREKIPPIFKGIVDADIKNVEPPRHVRSGASWFPLEERAEQTDLHLMLASLGYKMGMGAENEADGRGGDKGGARPSSGEGGGSRRGSAYGLRFSPKCQTPTQICRKRWGCGEKKADRFAYGTVLGVGRWWCVG